MTVSMNEHVRLNFISEPVTSVSFSRDGHCILVSCLDNRLRLLDKENGEMLNRLVSIIQL